MSWPRRCELRLLDIDCGRLVFGMRAHGNGAVLAATDEELDELIGFVAAEANHEPNRRRQHRLDAAFTALYRGSRPVTSPGPRPEPACDADPMALPELDVARVQRWCAGRVPEHALHQVRVECEVAPRHLTIIERRAPWREDFGPEWSSFPIARLRYSAADQAWSLSWRDRNLRFHAYDLLAPSRRVEDLLAEIDRDPTGIFWG